MTTDMDTDQTTPAAAVVEAERLSRAQRALLSLTGDVARKLAEEHGVCVRPLAMRRIDLTTGRVDVVPVPCGARREDQCRPCADKQRRLRQAQCRQGWHLDQEPPDGRAEPTEQQTQLMTVRADLHAASPWPASRTTRTSARRSGRRSPSSTKSYGPSACAASSSRSTRHPRSGAARPDVGRMRRTCLAGRWTSAPLAGSTAAGTGPPPSSP